MPRPNPAERMIQKMGANAAEMGDRYKKTVDLVLNEDYKAEIDEGLGPFAYAVKQVVEFSHSGDLITNITSPDIHSRRTVGPNDEPVSEDLPYSHALIIPRFREVEMLVCGTKPQHFEGHGLYMHVGKTNLARGITIVRLDDISTNTSVVRPRRTLYIARNNTVPNRG